jgi:hypothetical protein
VRGMSRCLWNPGCSNQRRLDSLLQGPSRRRHLDTTSNPIEETHENFP